MSSVEETQSNSDSWWSYEYQVIQCSGCKKIRFRSNWTSPEDMDWDYEEQSETLSDHFEYFPENERRERSKGFQYLPPSIAQMYHETSIALSKDLRVLAGVGIRGVVEAFCKDRGATGSNLEKRIKKLVEQGDLTVPQEQALHALRFMGNTAAHEFEAPTSEEIDAAMSIVDHTLDLIYVMPKMLERLSAKKSPTKKE